MKLRKKAKYNTTGIRAAYKRNKAERNQPQTKDPEPNEPIMTFGSSKICPICNINKPLEDYAMDTRPWMNKRQNVCKKCNTRERRPKFNMEVRRHFDNHCAHCGIEKSNSNRLEIHHIKSYKMYPELRFEVDNCLLLCHKCHMKLHKEMRGQWNKKGTTELAAASA